MKHDKLAQALDEVRSEYIAEAAAPKKNRKPLYWLGAMAAVLAVVILITMLSGPLALRALAVSIAETPQAPVRPKHATFDSEEYQQYQAAYDEQYTQLGYAKAALTPFFRNSTGQFLSGSESSNRIYSPLNLYFALSMLAVMAEGESRSQILDLLGVADMDDLRDQVTAVWQTIYEDGDYPRLPANSLWLNEGVTYNQEVMDILADAYYSSVYQGDFSDPATTRSLQVWIEQQTKGFLSADGVQLTPQMVMAIASTLYFRSGWSDEFSESDNTTDIFHAPNGDRECTFMNAHELQTDYYWGDSYSAVSLQMKGSNQMWLILPDEDKSVDDVLAEGQYMDTILAGNERENEKYMKVNLSLPKFDISSECDLVEGLQELGVTNVFDSQKADFSTALPGSDGVYISGVQQVARVVADEKGVTAAAFVLMYGAGAMAPAEEIIDFVLDRPFLFVITDFYGLPMFVGVVNQP